jgi:hypothetical protein
LERRRDTKRNGEREKEIISEDDEPEARSSTWLKSASDNKIVADSDNPDNSSSGSQVISNHELNHKTNGNSNCSSMHRTIEHSDDCDAAYSSDENIIPTCNGRDSRSTESTNYTYPRPRRKLIDFVLRLVVLNETRSGVGMLAFIWATVVLLGGFCWM